MTWIDDLLGKIISVSGIELPQRKILNFVAGDSGVDIVATDNPATGATDIEISGGVIPSLGSEGSIVFVDTGPVIGFGHLSGDVVNTTTLATTIQANAITAGKIASNAVTTAKILDANVTKAKLENDGALSVIGRSANSSGVPADISATPASGAVLRESGSTLGFGTIAAAGIASDAVTTAKILDANVTSAKLRNSAGLSVIGNATNASTVPADIVGTDGLALRVAGTALGFGTLLTAAISDNAITLAKMATQAALSVLANATNSTAVPTAVAAGTDGHILRRSGTALAFGKILTNFITGTSTNDNATAGDIGELLGPITRLRSNALSLTTNTAANVCTTTSITLTAGDWDIRGSIGFVTGATTSVTRLQIAVSKTSATLPGSDTSAVPTAGEVLLASSTAAEVPNGLDMCMVLPEFRVSVSGNTTIFLVANAVFTVSTMTVYGSLEARRAR